MKGASIPAVAIMPSPLFLWRFKVILFLLWGLCCCKADASEDNEILIQCDTSAESDAKDSLVQHNFKDIDAGKDVINHGYVSFMLHANQVELDGSNWIQTTQLLSMGH